MADLLETLNRAQALQRGGQVLEAHHLYRQVLEQDPRNPEALHNLSMLEIDLGNTDAAAALIKRLLAINPNFVPAHYNLALARQRAGDLDGALMSYRAALAREPNHALSLYNSAVILRGNGRLAEALRAYQTLARVEPQWSDALVNHAEVLLELGRPADALTVLDKLVAVEDSSSVHALRAHAFMKLGRNEEALSACNRALSSAPDDFALHHFRGNMLQLLNRYDEAIESYDTELAVIEGRSVSDAARGNAFSESISVRLTSCAWDRLRELQDAALSLTASGDFTIDPFIGVLWNDDPSTLLTWAERWQRRFGEPEPVSRAPAKSGAKIRLGYISADFREHAVARLLVDLIKAHDRSTFDVIGYATNSDDQSSQRRNLAAAFDNLVDLTALTDQQAAERIARDEIDVLIDLMGHTSNTRLGIIARRPAPVIAHYLGYPGSIGMDAVDYFIADATTLPPADEKDFREAIVRLPTTYQVNSAREISSRVFTRAEAGLPEAGVVFCGITRHPKLNPAVFDAWANILRQVPGSALWLLAGTPFVEANLKREAETRGVDPARLVFAPYIAAPDYLARHSLADLFLDTWPWGGHTMVSDALWTGLPVVTTPGRNFASRVGASLLDAVGMPELICGSRDAYVAKAVELAMDPAALKSLRHKLTHNRAKAPLFNTDRFRREIEAAYREMHARHQRDEKPSSFTAKP